MTFIGLVHRKSSLCRVKPSCSASSIGGMERERNKDSFGAWVITPYRPGEEVWEKWVFLMEESVWHACTLIFVYSRAKTHTHAKLKTMKSCREATEESRHSCVSSWVCVLAVGGNVRPVQLSHKSNCCVVGCYNLKILWWTLEHIEIECNVLWDPKNV